MDEDKYIEQQGELYVRVQQMVKRKICDPPTIEIINQIYDVVNRWMISDRIQKERAEHGKTQEESQAAAPTEKQLKYIESLGGDPAEFKTKDQASRWIEKNK